MLRTIESGPQISVTDVAALEQRYGLGLPTSYRNFLLTRNGGRPERDLFRVPGCDANPVARIHFFFGINDPVESCSLSWNIDTFAERLGGDLVPIATTEGADKICLSRIGSVVYWDGYSPSPTIYTVSPDFETFLTSLYRDENSPDLDDG